MRKSRSSFALSSLGLWVGLGVGPAGVSAQQLPQPANPALGRVEVSGERDVRRSSTIAKEVIGTADITRHGDATISEVLRRVPGVSVGGAPGRGTDIRLQGLGNGYTQLLINGDPAPAGFSIDTLSPALIERIEILRSPTADMSAQAIAGTINIILKQKTTPRTREIKAAVADASGKVSTFLDGQWSDRIGTLGYGLAAVLSRESNEWPSSFEQWVSNQDGTPQTQRHTDKTERSRATVASLAPRWQWRPRDGEEFAGDLLLRWRQADLDGEDRRTTAFGTPPLYAGNELDIDQRINNLRAAASWSRRLDADARIGLKAVAQSTTRRSTAHFTGLGADGALLLDEHTRSKAEDTSALVSGSYRTAWREHHALAIGWEAEQSRRREDRIQRQLAPEGYPAVDLDEDFDARVRRLAIFAQDEWEPRDDLSLYAGLRWEGLETRSLGGPQEVSNRSGVPSPMLQAVWRPRQGAKDQVRFSLGRTYRAPATRDLMPRRYVANDNTPTTPDLQGNPALEPELAWGSDLAYERYIDAAGMVAARLSLRRIDGVIVQRLSREDGHWISRPANGGIAETAGLQFDGNLTLAKLRPAWPAVDLRGSLGWNRSRVRDVPGPNNRLDKQVPFTASLGADYRLRDLPLSTGLSFTFQRGGRTALPDGQSAANGPKRILDLYGVWRFSSSVQLRLSAANLLHQDYLSELAYMTAIERFEQATRAHSSATVRAALEFRL